MNTELRIALLVWPTYAYFRGVLQGITRYAHSHTRWTINIQPNAVEAVAPMLAWAADGFIADLDSPELAQAIRATGKPAVNISNAAPNLGLPRVGPDEQAIGQLAAEYFLHRGFRHFAFAAIPGRAFSAERHAGFDAALAAHGLAATELADTGNLREARDHEQRLRAAIAGLPRPLAVLAASDAHAFRITEACRHLNLRMPDEVALMGVDDDDLFCTLMSPPLSSVIVPTERIGFEAAKLLDALMAGEDPPPSPLLLEPPGISTRRSSDAYALEDEDLLAAARFIRANTHRPIGVADILKQVPVSRSTLERKFRAVLGRTILEEIRRARIDQAKELLANTNLPMSLIAERVGFANQTLLSVTFRQVTGLTPTAYRRQLALPM